MDSKKNKLYYFIQLELLRLKTFNKHFWRRATSQVLKTTSSAHRVVWRAQDPLKKASAVNKLLHCSGE